MMYSSCSKNLASYLWGYASGDIELMTIELRVICMITRLIDHHTYMTKRGAY